MTSNAREDDEPAPWDLLANALGNLDDLEEDEDLALDVSEQPSSAGGQGADSFSKVPLEQARNLIQIRQMAAGVRDGSVTIENYRSKLKLMVRGLEEGLKVVRSDAMVKKADALPADQKAVFQQTAKLVEALVEGGQRMLRYPETKNTADIDEGLAVIEGAFQDLDNVQNKAIEIGREEAVRQAAMDK